MALLVVTSSDVDICGRKGCGVRRARPVLAQTALAMVRGISYMVGICSGAKSQGPIQVSMIKARSGVRPQVSAMQTMISRRVTSAGSADFRRGLNPLQMSDL